MWRYLKAAFWAKLDLPVVGPLPLNALVVGTFAALGFVEPILWLAAAGLETGYLTMLASNARFQKVVQGRELAAAREAEVQEEEDLAKTLAALDPPGAERHRQIEATLAAIEGHYQAHSDDDALLESNLETLRRLSELHLQLAVGHARLAKAENESDPAAQQRKQQSLERELANPALNESVRQSKQATLDLLTRRVATSGRRKEQLAEIAANLERIEAQMSLALDDASTKGAPAAVNANLEAYDRIITSNQDIASLYQNQ